MHDALDRADNAGNPYLTAPYGPVADECSMTELAVDGELPRDLVGTYVRNGPNAKYPPKGRYHWFDGDGMLHAVTFEDGRAHYRNRWVATAHLGEEDAARGALWTGLLHPVGANPAHAPYKDTANTDVIFFAGELLTTWYICGLPYRVDARTLDTRGVHDFGAGKPRRISAHSKVDLATGELLYFSYGPRPHLSYGVVDSAGHLAHSVDIAVPGPRLPHDMAVTENHTVLMDLPVFHTEQGIRDKRWRIAFHRDVPARFAVLPRRGSAAEVRWFEAEPCYIYHTVNAWEDGDEVVMVACRCDDPRPEPDYQRDGTWARMMANLRLRARLYEWRFNLVTGQTRERDRQDRRARKCEGHRVAGAESHGHDDD
ncbi:MAG: carotenoid oxygenase family protein, partial [Myxococcota bacterium]